MRKALFVLLLTVHVHAECPISPIELVGRVVADGRAIEGASVAVVSADRLIPSESPRLTAQTQSDGSFRLEYTFDTHSYSLAGADRCSHRPGRLALRTKFPSGEEQLDEYFIRDHHQSPVALAPVERGRPHATRFGFADYVASPGIWFLVALVVAFAVFVWKSRVPQVPLEF